MRKEQKEKLLEYEFNTDKEHIGKLLDQSYMLGKKEAVERLEEVVMEGKEHFNMGGHLVIHGRKKEMLEPLSTDKKE